MRMEPSSGDYCVCGHTYGWHSQDMNGPCLNPVETSGEPCNCPHWRYPIRDLADHIEGAMLVEARLIKSNPAAHDAWQLALQHLEPLRVAIERAREASK